MKTPKHCGTGWGSQREILALLLLAVVVGRTSRVQAGATPAESYQGLLYRLQLGRRAGRTRFCAAGIVGGASPEEHVAWYAALGCNVIQTFAVSCNGYAWYEGGPVPPQPGLKHDFLTEMVKLGHSRGMKVMGYYCVGANTLWGQTHTNLSYGAPSDPHIPFTRAYLDYLCGSIEDGLQRTGMDGFMIDWVWNPGDLDGVSCAGSECEQQMYRELFGEAFPGKDKITPERDLEFRRRAIDRCWERIRARPARQTECGDLAELLQCERAGGGQFQAVQGSRLADERSHRPEVPRASGSHEGPPHTPGAMCCRLGRCT